MLCVIQNEFVCSYNRHMNDLAKQPSKTANKLIVDRLAKKNMCKYKVAGGRVATHNNCISWFISIHINYKMNEQFYLYKCAN